MTACIRNLNAIPCYTKYSSFSKSFWSPLHPTLKRHFYKLALNWPNEISSNSVIRRRIHRASTIVRNRFARWMFSVNSSPFLLTETMWKHLSACNKIDPEFVREFTDSFHVDDFTTPIRWNQLQLAKMTNKWPNIMRSDQSSRKRLTSIRPNHPNSPQLNQIVDTQLHETNNFRTQTQLENINTHGKKRKHQNTSQFHGMKRTVYFYWAAPRQLFFL